MASMDLLEVVHDDLPTLIEFQGLVLKLSQPEVWTFMDFFILDLEILLDKNFQVTKLKKDSLTVLRRNLVF